MQFADYITVFNNISKNFYHLTHDFIGFQFNVSRIIDIINNIFITALMILIYYLVGRKIRLLFLKNVDYKTFNNFVDVALGYIFVNSGLAILGMFSLFHPVTLWTYIVTLLFISIYPYRSLKNSIEALLGIFNEIKIKAKRNKWVFFGVLLFVSISFFRLIPPEIGEDAIGYHTSNPHLFLKNNTTIVSHSYVTLPVPHLGEMSYVISEFVGIKDSARYIHFSFYFITVFLLILVNPYGALFFVTAPVVIQISSKANVDFQWILCWLLSILLVSQKKLNGARNAILIGILFGGVLATKLWTIAFFPLFILYLLIVHRKQNLVRKLNIIFIFFLSAFLIDVIWLWRSYIISGSPVYPVLLTSILDGLNGALNVSNIIGLNKLMFHEKNIIVFSPLFFLGIAVFLIHWRHALKTLLRFNLFSFFVLLAAVYLFIQYHFGRYLLGLYSLSVLIVSASISDIIKRYNLYKIILTVVFGIMFTYYFMNTLLILPYGFGLANSDKYLTRILSRDNSSYFDFDKKFSLFISSKDKVATFEIFGYYYANFDYIDINEIFDKDNKSFNLLAEKGVTKLFIKGGDIFWFCKRLNIINCNYRNAHLLASYPEGVGKYNLYNIVKAD